MTPTLWRTCLFLGIAYGYNGTLHGALPWLAIATIAHGMDFVRQTVNRWAADEAAKVVVSRSSGRPGVRPSAR